MVLLGAAGKNSRYGLKSSAIDVMAKTLRRRVETNNK